MKKARLLTLISLVCGRKPEYPERSQAPVRSQPGRVLLTTILTFHISCSCSAAVFTQQANIEAFLLKKGVFVEMMCAGCHATNQRCDDGRASCNFFPPLRAAQAGSFIHAGLNVGMLCTCSFTVNPNVIHRKAGTSPVLYAENIHIPDIIYLTCFLTQRSKTCLINPQLHTHSVSGTLNHSFILCTLFSYISTPGDPLYSPTHTHTNTHVCNYDCECA